MRADFSLNKDFILSETLTSLFRRAGESHVLPAQTKAASDSTIASLTTLFSEDFETFTAAGFNAAPLAGQLDSDLWRVTGLSEGAGTFGGTHVSNDFTRGTDANGGVTSGGVYAFEVSGNTFMGVQASGSDFTPGEITLAYTNTTGSTLADLTVTYDLWVNNDQSRANSFAFAWSTDDVSYTSVGALTYTSGEASDGLGFQLVQDEASTTLTGINLAAGQTLYLQWQGDDVSGGGSRDEFGIDDVRLTTGTVGPDTTAPTLSSSNPADNGSLFDGASNLTLSFNETVVAGTGNITLFNEDGSVFEAFNVATSSRVSFSGTNVILDPTAALIEGNNYYIQVDSTAVLDGAGNAFAGISDATTLNFDVQSLKIGAIQGTGDTAALLGQTVTISAIVTGDFQTGTGEDGDLGGFFIQDGGDGNALTSDGIFVYDGGSSVADVTKGDRVTVTGTVIERFGKTTLDISSGSLTITNPGEVSDITTLVQTVDPSLVGARSASGGYRADMEAYESMLVDFSETLTIIETRNVDNFGEFTVSTDGILYQFTQVADNADITAANYDAYLQSIGADMFLIDDGFDGTGNPITWPDGSLETADSFRVGNTIGDAFGIMDFGFSNFRLRGVDTDLDGAIHDEFTIDTTANARPTDVGVDGALNVASVNVENFFVTLGSRGAATAAEFQDQLDKLVAGLLAVDADVYGLVEIENDFDFDGNSPLEVLVGALNTAVGANVFSYVDPGQTTVGTDAIANAFIYRNDVVEVTQGTSTAILDDGDLAGLGITDLGDHGAIFDGRNSNRNPLAVSFTELDSGHSFTATVNHFKSKGGTGSGANADRNDGVADWNEVRTLGAEALDLWMQTNPTGLVDGDVLILGDLNAYAAEDPIDYLSSNGYQDLNATIGANDYSYFFSALAGTLDYTIANDSLAAQAIAFEHWQGNSVEAEVLNYEFASDFPSAFDGTTPWRFSDHDAAIVSLMLGTFNGTDGDDVLTGTGLVDTINGGLGSDLIEGKAGADAIDGGGNFDTVTYANDTASVIVNLDNVARSSLALRTATDGSGATDTLRFIENVIGTNFNDTVWGSATRNLLDGGSGDDVLRGRAGNDTFIGGLGDDRLRGDSGFDTADYSAATSAVTVNLALGTASDGLGGTDALFSIEQVFGGSGDDVFTGSDINDRFFGNDGMDSADGGLGNDIMFGGADDDILNGESNSDRLYGESGDDILNGGIGDDILDGGAGLDTLNGGAGTDRLFGRDGADTLSGGDDTDFLNGQGGHDILDGGAARDFLRGHEGNDRLTGGEGNDRIDGGDDTDTIVFSGNEADYTIILRANGVLSVEDNNTADGDDGFDVITNAEFLEFADGTVDIAGL